MSISVLAISGSSIVFIMAAMMGPIVAQHILECGTFSTAATVEPPISRSTSNLIEWQLFSDDQLCSEPAKKPVIGPNKRKLNDVSLIATCPNCPKCSVVLPQAYELPLTLQLQTIFLVTKQIPYNKHTTDMDVRYVLVDRLPQTTKNCIIRMRGRDASDGGAFSAANMLMVLIVVLSVLGCLCCIRCICHRRGEEDGGGSGLGTRRPSGDSYLIAAAQQRAVQVDPSSSKLERLSTSL